MSASRLIPSGDTGATLPYDGPTWQNLVHREIAALWRYVVEPLTNVAGTNTITATTDTTVVAAPAAYAKGQKVSIIPAVTNTGAVTLNRDALGALAVKDVDGNALVAGALLAGREYILEHDGTNFRKYDGSLLTISNGVPMIVRDEKTTNTDAGTFTSGSMVKRTLNTIASGTISGASLASSQITLPAGTYYVEWSSPGNAIGLHITQFYNATDSTIVETGQSMYANTTNGMNNSSGCANFTISSPKAFELQHRAGTTKTTDGLGAKSNLGAKEVYAIVAIWKTA